MNEARISTAELKAFAEKLRAGDRVLLSGEVFTARDAAHKKLIALLDDGAPLPFELKDALIYYAGPTPGHDDIVIGSCGPTTSSRMDRFAPRLYDLGLAGTIGKGERSAEVAKAVQRNKAVYLCAVGGAGALIARHIKSADEIAFPELGCESVKRLTVEDLPLVVALDCHGGNLFKDGREQYRLA